MVGSVFAGACGAAPQCAHQLGGWWLWLYVASQALLMVVGLAAIVGIVVSLRRGARREREGRV